MPDPLSTTFAALSDPTRRAILAHLALGETSVKELAEPFSITAPSITKHLKVLERAGLISRSCDAQWRVPAVWRPPASGGFRLGRELSPILGTQHESARSLPFRT